MKPLYHWTALRPHLPATQRQSVPAARMEAPRGLWRWLGPHSDDPGTVYLALRSTLPVLILLKFLKILSMCPSKGRAHDHQLDYSRRSVPSNVPPNTSNTHLTTNPWPYRSMRSYMDSKSFKPIPTLPKVASSSSTGPDCASFYRMLSRLSHPIGPSSSTTLAGGVVFKTPTNPRTTSSCASPLASRSTIAQNNLPMTGAFPVSL